MPDPISFSDASPRYKLPFLFAGQAQKEFIVNEAHALIDMLLHPAIEGEASAPPATSEEGECWLVGTSPAGEWQGHEGQIACSQPGGWVFASPRDGMVLLDKSSGRAMLYLSGWRAASLPAPPTGGTLIDAEARTAIAELTASLQQAGILPSGSV